MKKLHLKFLFGFYLALLGGCLQSSRARSDLLEIDSALPKQGDLWYVTYGSNLLKARFMCYITGGICPINNRPHDGCTDKTPPKADVQIRLPYRLYFGSSAGTWEDKGVAFLKRSKLRQNETLGRGYKITVQQFREIWIQEGQEPEWYGHLIRLPDFQKLPAFTFTSAVDQSPNPPPSGYQNVILKGLGEAYPEISAINRQRYLNTRIIDVSAE